MGHGHRSISVLPLSAPQKAFRLVYLSSGGPLWREIKQKPQPRQLAEYGRQLLHETHTQVLLPNDSGAMLSSPTMPHPKIPLYFDTVSPFAYEAYHILRVCSELTLCIGRINMLTF